MSDFDVKTFKIPGQHYLDGVLLGGYSPRESIEMVKTFDMFEDDCVVSAYPKSGQTWTLELLYLILHYDNYSENEETDSLLRTPWLELGKIDNARIRELGEVPRPRVFKTHVAAHQLPEQMREKHSKMIHVLRNPKDVAVSYYHFYRMDASLGRFPGTWSQFYEMFMAGNVSHGSWFDHVLQFWREYKDNKDVLFLHYEDMVKDHAGAVRKIANFLGKSLNENVAEEIVRRTSFGSMKQNPATNFSKYEGFDYSVSHFYRKGKVGDWKNYFTVQQNDEFDEVYRAKMADSGLNVDFGE
ncbi:sulfotransferase 1C4 [Lingula anatina]|uniref:Sulfotransferase 1C4 n=1 Tax=Lingula anatina TaxID=7574 RepID=A0A1S3K7K5_LINAN|nr:sulfotransferase 1C4 [Lingula anatina]|eukprot:XP_013418477.1 sulfotransferase 1C4 [Lingula anatina]